jgi:hypothetical protein
MVKIKMNAITHPLPVSLPWSASTLFPQGADIINDFLWGCPVNDFGLVYDDIITLLPFHETSTLT